MTCQAEFETHAKSTMIATLTGTEVHCCYYIVYFANSVFFVLVCGSDPCEPEPNLANPFVEVQSGVLKIF
jgi:hypothetical protein